MAEALQVNDKDSSLFGCEMIFKMNERNIKTKYDIIICFAHWVLTRHGFLCGGVGDDTSLPNRSELSELLPDGWNTDPPFKLRYFYKNQLYILSGLVDEGDLILNLSRPSDSRVFASVVREQDVTQTSGPIEKMMPSYAQVRSRIEKELIDPMEENEVTKDANTQTSNPPNPVKLVPTAQRVCPSLSEFPCRISPGRPAVSVGQDDLLPPFLPNIRPNPLGIGGGGGMLFQPPGMGPRGSFVDPSLPTSHLPPGARYDPIRPPGVGSIRPQPPGTSRDYHPDHDHLPPPGYDDMFM